MHGPVTISQYRFLSCSFGLIYEMYIVAPLEGRKKCEFVPFREAEEDSKSESCEDESGSIGRLDSVEWTSGME